MVTASLRGFLLLLAAQSVERTERAAVLVGDNPAGRYDLQHTPPAHAVRHRLTARSTAKATNQTFKVSKRSGRIEFHCEGEFLRACCDLDRLRRRAVGKALQDSLQFLCEGAAGLQGANDLDGLALLSRGGCDGAHNRRFGNAKWDEVRC